MLTWTTVGAEHAPDAERERLAEVFAAMDWQSVPCEMAMMPGMAIKELVKGLRLGRAIEVASSNMLAPYGLVAVHAQRGSQGIHLYAVDTGCEVIPLAHEIYNLPKAVPA